MILLHFRFILKQLFRIPAFLVPTVLFPTMLYLFFGGPDEARPDDAVFALGSFCVFAVMGVAFYQFGVGIAEDRGSPWENFMRVLPVTLFERFTARIMAAAVIASLGVICLGISGWSVGVTFPIGTWISVGLALLAGTVPFCLFGVALGYLAPQKAAVPIANLIYLPLSFLGSVWSHPDSLPDSVAVISPFLPSRMFAELVWAAIEGRFHLPMLGWLALYSAGAALLCVWTYRRHESRAYA
ncbi:MAG: ABC transporter permease [Rhodospirillaceae bacterium]|jgi:ABC-2 type transport system permease protein|nr:ABC transporter permease [Rhodospirillaceae bacterium]MBT3495084.1 ABC transporter permease [Rhodospirillaceae bacterium]MBT3782781.1 ABC transporter permease [Rhodospirillaceae bacterium]MBT4171102.1 ABC transporter permease [Rhodospirillaceae bacterium]MBT4561540.1 ABC transporter permease [Rhodospirillaceae bacterium]